MTLDLRLLAYSAVLTWLMILTAALLRTRLWTPKGLMLGFSNRDNLPEASPVAARADRAAKNMLENMVLFVALLAAARLGGVQDERVVLGARLFFWARVAYFPLYLAGVPYLRTLSWAVGLAGMGFIFAATVA